eukprot:TRINITY_DN61316_c0_g1_i1.p1 TRINITY_DN61316_c0_g1~~TRINITY_DN61316_c0_g1_i1.p1  ORF type:complete len:869 (+),score=170.48 TRINITY_DN61316_c0_g1_i1:43-2607(+)
MAVVIAQSQLHSLPSLDAVHVAALCATSRISDAAPWRDSWHDFTYCAFGQPASYVGCPSGQGGSDDKKIVPSRLNLGDGFFSASVGGVDGTSAAARQKPHACLDAFAVGLQEAFPKEDIAGQLLAATLEAPRRVSSCCVEEGVCNQKGSPALRAQAPPTSATVSGKSSAAAVPSPVHSPAASLRLRRASLLSPPPLVLAPAAPPPPKSPPPPHIRRLNLPVIAVAFEELPEHGGNAREESVAPTPVKDGHSSVTKAANIPKTIGEKVAASIRESARTELESTLMRSRTLRLRAEKRAREESPQQRILGVLRRRSEGSGPSQDETTGDGTDPSRIDGVDACRNSKIVAEPADAFVNGKGLSGVDAKNAAAKDAGDDVGKISPEVTAKTVGDSSQAGVGRASTNLPKESVVAADVATSHFGNASGDTAVTGGGIVFGSSTGGAVVGTSGGSSGSASIFGTPRSASFGPGLVGTSSSASGPFGSGIVPSTSASVEGGLLNVPNFQQAKTLPPAMPTPATAVATSPLQSAPKPLPAIVETRALATPTPIPGTAMASPPAVGTLSIAEAITRVELVEEQLKKTIYNDKAKKDFRNSTTKTIGMSITQASATVRSIMRSSTALSDYMRNTVAKLTETERLFAELKVAARLADEAEVGIRAHVRAAWPVAHVATQVFLVSPTVEELFRGIMHKACPYLTPDFSGSEAGRTAPALGQLPNENLSNFVQRMVGYARLWFATLVLQDDLAAVWRWLAQTLNAVSPSPAPIAATLLLTVLEIAGAATQARYKRQFDKLVDYIRTEYRPSLEKALAACSASETPFVQSDCVRLRVWLEEFAKTRQAPPPPGRSIETVEEAALNRLA